MNGDERSAARFEQAIIQPASPHNGRGRFPFPRKTQPQKGLRSIGGSTAGRPALHLGHGVGGDLRAGGRKMGGQTLAAAAVGRGLAAGAARLARAAVRGVLVGAAGCERRGKLRAGTLGPEQKSSDVAGEVPPRGGLRPHREEPHVGALGRLCLHNVSHHSVMLALSE